MEKILFALLTAGVVLAAFPEKFVSDMDKRLWNHLRILLKITTPGGNERHVKLFTAGSAALGVFTVVLLIGKIPLPLVMTAGAVDCLIPYAVLRMRLEQIRVESSREGEILITELLNNYRIYFFNMQQAIEKTALTIEEAPNSKRLLFNLSRGLNTAGSEEEIGELIEEFRLSIKTSWGNLLAQNMYFALTSGTRVNDAISNLAGTIERARKLDEYSGRQNNEARLMLKYLAPATYIMTVFCGLHFFGLTPAKYINYQFRTEAGLTWFIISALTYLTGIAVRNFISRTKLDF